MTVEQIKELGVARSDTFTVETDKELTERNNTRDAMFEARKGAACAASWDAVRTPLREAVQKSISRDPEDDFEFITSWNAIREAVSATITQDLLTFEQHKTLVALWENVLGPIKALSCCENARQRIGMGLSM